MGVIPGIKKPQELVDFRFSSEMGHKSIQVLGNGKEIKRTVEGNWSVFALVSPAASGSIRVRVVRSGGYIHLGLAHKQQMMQSGYQWPKNSQGVYLIQGDSGCVYNVLDPRENRKYSSLRFSPGEVVEMEYDPPSETLRYQNKSRNINHTLKNIKQQEGNPLHLCVLMHNKDDQVEIL